MISKGKQAIRAAILLAMAPAALVGAVFVAPNDGPVPFRRDRIPLEQETMVGLSNSLGVLAKGLKPENGVERRGAAQMIALALALNPGDQATRELIGKFKSGGGELKANADRVVKSRAKVWQYIGWLESPEAGKDGQALAACLKDVIVLSDPKDPRAEELGGNHGEWAGWIPPVAAYQRKEKKTGKEVVVKNLEKKEEEDPAKPETPEVMLTQAMVRTPLWRLVRAANSENPSEPDLWELELAPLTMSAVKKDDLKDLNLVLGSPKNQGGFKSLQQSIRKLASSRHEAMPKGWEVSIDSPILRAPNISTKRPQSISAAAAVLADAALSGVEPAGTIIGKVDEQGGFSLPTRFWTQLKSLKAKQGGRLIVPAEAEPFLFSILAMEQPEFFLNHQVLMARDFDSLVRFSEKVPSGKVAEAMLKFGEIRNRSSGQNTRQYIANRYVRQRLAEVLQDSPNNLSAKMLLIQASGNRPSRISRPVLADELLEAMQPMAWVVEMSSSRLRELKQKGVRVGTAHENCREKLDAFERYVATEDEKLYDKVMDVVNIVRNLDRSLRLMGDDYTENNAVMKTHAAMVETYRALVLELRGELKTK